MKVSVVVLTYNHERYIRQAIESVLMQETDFDFEVLITEDCSTDNTRQILYEFQQRYPERIRLLLSPRNLCTNEVFTRAIDGARGEYIATVDGDDYWTSSDKLKRQVAFLDSRPECSMVFHNALVVQEDGAEGPWRITPEGFPEISTLDDLWGTGAIAFCSVMVRRSVFSVYPDWFIDAEVGDWAVKILAGQQGRIGYIPDVMGVYRRHAGGIWWQLSHPRKLHRLIRFFRRLDRALDGMYNRQISRVIEGAGTELRSQIGIGARRGDWSQAVSAASLFTWNFPGEVLRDAVTEVWPSYRPRRYRRRPLLHRVLGRVWRQGVSGHRSQRYEGYVDQADATAVAGWVRDLGRPGARIDVMIWDGPELLAVVPADRFRKDLLDAGKGTGYHAFLYRPADRLGRDAGQRIRVTVAGDDWRVPGRPD